MQNNIYHLAQDPCLWKNLKKKNCVNLAWFLFDILTTVSVFYHLFQALFLGVAKHSLYTGVAWHPLGMHFGCQDKATSNVLCCCRKRLLHSVWPAWCARGQRCWGSCNWLEGVNLKSSVRMWTSIHFCKMSIASCDILILTWREMFNIFLF